MLIRQGLLDKFLRRCQGSDAGDQVAEAEEKDEAGVRGQQAEATSQETEAERQETGGEGQQPVAASLTSPAQEAE